MPAMYGSPFLNKVRDVIRTRQFTYSTEKTYIGWVYRYIIFHGKRHPGEMSGKEVADFLSYLAVVRKVSASTQNQALNALAFLYREVLKVPLNEFEFQQARVGKRLPVVLSREEAKKIIAHLKGEFQLMVSLLYGSGLRLSECLNLRVKDIDFELKEIVVREGKGGKDRRTLLPVSLVPTLKMYLDRA